MAVGGAKLVAREQARARDGRGDALGTPVELVDEELWQLDGERRVRLPDEGSLKPLAKGHLDDVLPSKLLRRARVQRESVDHRGRAQVLRAIRGELAQGGYPPLALE